MTQTFAVDKNNDIYIGPDGNLAFKRDFFAVMQNCEHAAKAQFQEMVLNYDNGVPNFQTIWNGSPNIPQFIAALRVQLENVEGVLEVTELNADFRNNVLSYSARILTVYGEGFLNG